MPSIVKSKSKIKVLRVITSPEVVMFHLKNFIKFKPEDIDVVIVGTDVSAYSTQFPSIRFIDCKINRKIRLFEDLQSVLKLCSIIRSERPDIVHSIMPKSGLVAALAAFLSRVPVRMHTFTGQVWATKKSLGRFALKTIDQLIVCLNTLCLTDSPSQSQFLSENGVRSKGQPLRVLGSGSLDGIDLARFDLSKKALYRDEIRKQNGIPDSAFVYLYLGRKNRDKGVHLIFEAFQKIRAEHPDSYLLYVGPSEPDDIVGSVGQDQLKNIIVVGRTDVPEKYISASDVFCLPSYREGFGTSVIECAALGVPTLGSRIPGLVDSIQDNKTGLLFEKNSAQALYTTMQRIYSDRALLTSLSLNSIDYAKQRFDAPVFHKFTYELYRSFFS